MGNINPSKVPKKILRKDAHVPVKLYGKGGKVKHGR